MSERCETMNLSDMPKLKRLRLSPTRGLVEDDGGIYPIGVSAPMVLADEGEKKFEWLIKRGDAYRDLAAEAICENMRLKEQLAQATHSPPVTAEKL